MTVIAAGIAQHMRIAVGMLPVKAASALFPAGDKHLSTMLNEAEKQRMLLTRAYPEGGKINNQAQDIAFQH